jgi:hypothetical protein
MRERWITNITTHLVEVIAKELGGLQPLAKLINDFVHTLRDSRHAKNFMGLKKIAR